MNCSRLIKSYFAGVGCPPFCLQAVYMLSIFRKNYAVRIFTASQTSWNFYSLPHVQCNVPRAVHSYFSFMLTLMQAWPILFVCMLGISLKCFLPISFYITLALPSFPNLSSLPYLPIQQLLQHFTLPVLSFFLSSFIPCQLISLSFQTSLVFLNSGVLLRLPLPVVSDKFVLHATCGEWARHHRLRFDVVVFLLHDIEGSVTEASTGNLCGAADDSGSSLWRTMHHELWLATRAATMLNFLGLICG